MIYTNLTQKIYWALNFGRMPKRLTDFEFLSNGLKDAPPAVFFLSTGRTATLWFAHLLSKARNSVAFHEPFPQLHIQNRYAYQLWNSNKYRAEIKAILKQIFLAGRSDYLLRAARAKKTYIETNHFLTFFAPVIAELLPNAKFVHIYRHPGDFIRSAISKTWYAPDSSRNIALITCPCQQWNSMDRIEKLAWLWNETNSFIEDFISSAGEERVFRFNFRDIKDPKRIKELMDFLGVYVKAAKVKRLISKPQNKSRTFSYPHYSDWREKDKHKVREICGQLTDKYGFIL